MTSSGSGNRLAGEKSPYLLQHCENPVDWYPWGSEAFEKARRENKPVFLSVGYSTCHWCHVMAHESFEDPEVGRLLRESFVSIKVDREERPDVDRMYMAFVQATTGGGGWPMSVWLTPDLKPIVGGTYFPPEDRYGRPGFKTVLHRIASVWTQDREKLIEQGNRIIEALREQTATTGNTGDPLTATTIENAFRQIARSFDPEEGGFGGAPKFPRPVTLNFLFHLQAHPSTDRDRARQALEMATFTLRKMAGGGMHDHLGGGFHRYSVDAFWHVPHFEKMLYDQAQLATACVEAFQITKEPLFEEVARDILAYVRRDMTSPGGGFYSAEDADSLFEHGKPGHGEGAFYVWSRDEIDAALGSEDASLFCRMFGVEAEGNAPGGSDPHGEFTGKNILIRRYTDEEAAHIQGLPPQQARESLARSRARLFELREKRPRPHLDDKIITAWNGLMISAFARAAQAFDDAEALDVATRAANFLRENLLVDGQLRRSYRNGAGDVPAFADDYAFLIQGLLDLYETNFETTWLQWAHELQAAQDRLFHDAKHGGYFSVRADAPDILVRMKDDYDGAEPSANSIAARNLLRLSQFTGDDTMRARAEETIRAFGLQLTRAPHAMPQMLVALAHSLRPPQQIVITGNRTHPDTRALIREVHHRYLPGKSLILAGDGNSTPVFENDFLKSLRADRDQPAAYVCENFTCRLPVTSPEKLAGLLESLP